ncbi:CxC2 domain-containing protein [Mycena kentingensis (nom. inval.)]|nr:CxC2 domain-containing protein [Mycena kentingensis (nom. inval.)]
MKRGRPRKADALADFEQDTFLRGAPVYADRRFEVSTDGHRVITELDNLVASQAAPVPQPIVEADPRLTGWTALPSDSLDAEERLLAHQISSYDVEPDPELCDGELAQAQRKRYQSSDHPMSVWLPQAPLFLDELLRRDGLGDFVDKTVCAYCPKEYGAADVRMFCCRHCGDFLQCGKCVLHEHARRPLHTIQEWTGQAWSDLDMHAPTSEGGLGLEYQLGHHGFRCANPGPAKGMVVVDTKTLFEQGMTKKERIDEYWKRKGMDQVMGGNRQQMLMDRMATDEGEGVSNLELLSAQMHAAGGKGYFVGDRYKKHLESYVSEKDVSSCTSFAALLHKDTKTSTGLRVSGVGGVVCARHGLVRRQGMGDLQKGERYANIDFIILATLEDERVIAITISYDVVCQWHKLLPQRAQAIRGRGGTTTDLSKFEMQYVLPVWHAAAHEIACRTENSISFAVGVGKTDGEGIERLWSLLNPISWSTKEMGEGARHDVLEDKIDYLNFEKNTKIGGVIKRKLIVAQAELITQEREYKELTKSLKRETRDEWQRIYEEWKADRTKPNPFMLLPGNAASALNPYH